MQRVRPLAGRLAVLAAAALAGCGPVRVAQGGRPAPPVAVAEPRVLSFEIDQALLPSKLPQAADGRTVFARDVGGRSCVGCHGTDGTPQVAGAPDFRRPDWIRARTPLELQAFLAEDPQHGYGQSLSLQERWDVLAYCRFLSVDMEAIRETSTGRFGKNCNVCHGNKGFGNGFLAPTMQPPPRNLTDFNHWGIHRTDQEIFDNIWYGVHWSAMPPWRGTLPAEDVWAIVDFIRALQYDPPQD